MDFGCIFIICMLSHGLILLNNGFFWDDNIYYGLIRGGYYEEFSSFILETGLPINIYFFRGLDWLVGIENHRWVSLFSIFTSAVLLNQIFKSYFDQCQSISLMYAVMFVVVYPFKSTVLLCTTVYQVMLLFFIMAVFIRAHFGRSSSSVIRSVAQIGFALLSFISFNTASILTLFYFYFIFECFRACDFRMNFKAMMSYFRQNAIFLTLPILYWALKIVYFPTHGEYVYYNKINFDLLLILNSYKSFFIALFVPNLLIEAASRSTLLWLIVGFMLPLLIIFPCATKWVKFKVPLVKKDWRFIFFWLCGFLFISAFPYSLINLNPSYRGFESRHLILFTLSLPAFVLGAMVLYFERVKKVIVVARIDYLFRSVFIYIVAIGVIGSVVTYYDYQALAIKQESIVENLKVKTNLKKYSNFTIEDQIGDFSVHSSSPHELTHQAWYEWAAIFKKAWGEERWYGNNSDLPNEHKKGIRYGSSQIREDDFQCKLLLRSNDSKDKTKLVHKYWALKYFGSAIDFRRYLLEISSIEACE